MYDELPARLYYNARCPPEPGSQRPRRDIGDERPPVLVVDDHETIREVVSLVLEEAGYCVQQAPDGWPALQQMRASRDPMVVLLDMEMPGMDGVAVMRAVAADTALAAQHVYVLVTANAAALPLAFATLLAQLNVPVVPKPFDIDELVEAVDAAARRLTARTRAWSAGDMA